VSKACFTRPNSSLSCIRTCRVKLQHVSCGLPSGTLPSVSPVHIMNTAVLFFAWSVTEFRFPVQRTTCTTVSLMRFTTASFDERDTYECEAILCLWAVYGGPQSRVPTRIISLCHLSKICLSVIARVVLLDSVDLSYTLYQEMYRLAVGWLKERRLYHSPLLEFTKHSFTCERR